MLLAKKLVVGDRIGVIAPSHPVTEEYWGQFHRGIQQLKDLGFEVELAPNVYSNSLKFSASPQEKADDLHRMFLNPEISAIICAVGGSNSNSCLPFIHWEAIQNNPKIFIGMSDITVLLNAIYAKTGLITFHGIDVIWGFGGELMPYEVEEFFNRLVKKEKRIMFSKGCKTVISGRTCGNLLGGNLNCLLKLAGTGYLPAFDRAILLVEQAANSLDTMDSHFSQLQQLGILDRVAGVVVGYIDGIDSEEETKGRYEEILLSKLGKRSIPILKVYDFGHNCPNTMLPIGAEVSLDADRHELTILSECLL